MEMCRYCKENGVGVKVAAINVGLSLTEVFLTGTDVVLRIFRGDLDTVPFAVVYRMGRVIPNAVLIT